MEAQVLRRLFESIYLFKYSPSATMHILGYLTGVCVLLGATYVVDAGGEALWKMQNSGEKYQDIVQQQTQTQFNIDPFQAYYQAAGGEKKEEYMALDLKQIATMVRIF